MSARVEVKGLTELQSALRRLPEDLSDESGDIIAREAQAMAMAAKADYPEGPTGNLKRGVTVEYNRSKFGHAAIVKSRARHAAIFERGTGPRQDRRGANRGRMPAASDAQAFVPKAIRARKRITDQLVALVRRAGFEVDTP